ncbi:hypothetical protein EVAR_52238_1 [Eumeta japonica]|uniref:Uncharacterized protein n=1 Tax=Eumeta variegata TaxID=151549 RepID=A0A4C1Z4N0_EUMVA|nr:hypothetical protein EVAR_52238_1 [Eumeta japonica]
MRSAVGKPPRASPAAWGHRRLPFMWPVYSANTAKHLKLHKNKQLNNYSTGKTNGAVVGESSVWLVLFTKARAHSEGQLSVNLQCISAIALLTAAYCAASRCAACALSRRFLLEVVLSETQHNLASTYSPSGAQSGQSWASIYFTREPPQFPALT